MTTSLTTKMDELLVAVRSSDATTDQKIKIFDLITEYIREIKEQL